MLSSTDFNDDRFCHVLWYCSVVMFQQKYWVFYRKNKQQEQDYTWLFLWNLCLHSVTLVHTKTAWKLTFCSAQVSTSNPLNDRLHDVTISSKSNGAVHMTDIDTNALCLYLGFLKSLCLCVYQLGMSLGILLFLKWFILYVVFTWKFLQWRSWMKLARSVQSHGPYSLQTH